MHRTPDVSRSMNLGTYTGRVVASPIYQMERNQILFRMRLDASDFLVEIDVKVTKGDGQQMADLFAKLSTGARVYILSRLRGYGDRSHYLLTTPGEVYVT
jgi:hypothetical protein